MFVITEPKYVIVYSLYRHNKIKMLQCHPQSLKAEQILLWW